MFLDYNKIAFKMSKTVLRCSRYFKTIFMCHPPSTQVIRNSAHYSNWSNSSVINNIKVTTKASSPDASVYPVSELDAIKREFQRLKGGQILLRKDEDIGVAYITLDHPEKKNGFSGN